MQIQVVDNTSPQLFTAMLFPEATPETKNWLQEQWQRGTTMLTDMGRQYAQRAEETWKQLYDPTLMRQARSMMRRVGGILHPNSITYLEDVRALQTAKPIMQRYIMALPELRKIYHRQMCDGFSDSYVDLEPKAIGEAHYDYRRVMDGMVVMTDLPDGKTGWTVTMYPDELHEGDRRLEIDEQDMIQSAWEVAKSAILRRIDPTDVFNGKLEI